MSEREIIAKAFASWVSSLKWPRSGGPVFSAPYGVIEGLESGNRARGITFGVSRISDIHLSIYSPKYLLLRDSRFGTAKCTSIEEVKAILRENYRLPEPVGVPPAA